MGKHKHHIIPKHMGGSNDLSNLIELTVEEHAEAHRVLYEQHGHWQDEVAWKALTGQITSDDIRRIETIMTWTGRKHTEETKEKIREARKKQKNTNRGYKHTEESLVKMSAVHKGKKLTESHKQKTSDALKGITKPKLQCPHCGNTGGAPQMKQWHFDNCKLKG